MYVRSQGLLPCREHSPPHPPLPWHWGSGGHYSDGLGNSSRKRNLAVGLTYVPLFVRTSAALTRPSSPGRTRVMRPRGQRPRGEFSSTTNTRSPVASVRTSRCHFCRSVRDRTYSRSQPFQKWLVITWACLHLFLLLMSRSVTISIGRLLLARPIKKWRGVNASSSCGSLLTCVSGRLFNSDSTSLRKVSRVWSVTRCLAATAFRDFFADWTRGSQAPQNVAMLVGWSATESLLGWVGEGCPILSHRIHWKMGHNNSSDSSNGEYLYSIRKVQLTIGLLHLIS